MNSSVLICVIALLLQTGASRGVDAAIDLYRHGKFQEAAQNLSALTRNDPAEAQVLLWLGKSYLKLRRWNEAVDEFEALVKLEPTNGLYHLWLARAYGNKAAHVNFLSAWGLARKARGEFEKAVQLSPDSLDARFDLLQFYAEAPGIVGGGDEKAEVQAGEIARLSPRAGYTARAEIFEEKKQWDKAREQYTEATEKFPKNPNGFVDLAAFLMGRGDYAAAKSAAEKAVALDGTIPAARMWLAAARIELKSDVADALKVLQGLAAGPLTDNDPSFEEVYYWLGQGHLALGQEADARRAFETSLNFDPEYSLSKKALSQIKLHL